MQRAPASAASWPRLLAPGHGILSVAARSVWTGKEPLIPTGVHMAGNDRAGSKVGGDRDKSLETALAQIERQFGKGSIMRLGDEGRAPIEGIPTGSIALEVGRGIGGLARGRVGEVYRPEGSGR